MTIQPKARLRPCLPSKKKPASVRGRKTRRNSYELNSIARSVRLSTDGHGLDVRDDVGDRVERFDVRDGELDAQLELHCHDEVHVGERVPPRHVTAASPH